MKKLRYVLFVMAMILIPTIASAKSPVNVYVFYGETCPHCEDLFTFLDELKEDKEYKNKFKIVKYETWSSTENNELMSKVSDYLNADASGVPFYIIGDYYGIGFPSLSSSDEEVKARVEEVENEIKDNIKEAYKKQAKDKIAKVISGEIEVTTTTATSTSSESTTEESTTSLAEQVSNKIKNDESFSSEVKWLIISIFVLVALVISYVVIKWVIKD